MCLQQTNSDRNVDGNGMDVNGNGITKDNGISALQI